MYIIKLLFVNDDIVYDDYKYLEKYVGDERNGYLFTNLRKVNFSHFLQHLR